MKHGESLLVQGFEKQVVPQIKALPKSIPPAGV